MTDNNVSYATSDEDWEAWKQEELIRDALYDEAHPESEE